MTWKRKKTCCDSEECVAFKARSIMKYPPCLIRRREREASLVANNQKRVLEYLGNKCRDCDAEYSPLVKVPTRTKDKTLVPAICLDVEHVIWQKKTLTLGTSMKRNFEKILKPELDRCECVLLCKYCHAIQTKKLHKDKKYMAKKIEIHKATWQNQWTKPPQALNSTSA